MTLNIFPFTRSNGSKETAPPTPTIEESSIECEEVDQSYSAASNHSGNHSHSPCTSSNEEVPFTHSSNERTKDQEVQDLSDTNSAPVLNVSDTKAAIASKRHLRNSDGRDLKTTPGHHGPNHKVSR